jgi:hypothetical protein
MLAASRPEDDSKKHSADAYYNNRSKLIKNEDEKNAAGNSNAATNSSAGQRLSKKSGLQAVCRHFLKRGKKGKNFVYKAFIFL